MKQHLGRCTVIALTFLVSHKGLAQTYGSINENASSSGSCSPITGSVGGSMTINCTGIPAKKMNEMLGIMNKVLASQVDMSVLLPKLQQLIDSLGDTNSLPGEAMARNIVREDGQCGRVVEEAQKKIDESVGELKSGQSETFTSLPDLSTTLTPIYYAQGDVSNIQMNAKVDFSPSDLAQFQTGLQNLAENQQTLAGSITSYSMAAMNERFRGWNQSDASQEAESYVQIRSNSAQTVETIRGICRALHALRTHLD